MEPNNPDGERPGDASLQSLLVAAMLSARRQPHVQDWLVDSSMQRVAQHNDAFDCQVNPLLAELARQQRHNVVMQQAFVASNALAQLQSTEAERNHALALLVSSRQPLQADPPAWYSASSCVV